VERGNRKPLGIAKKGLEIIHNYDHKDLEPMDCPLRRLEASLKVKFRQLGDGV